MQMFLRKNKVNAIFNNTVQKLG